MMQITHSSFSAVFRPALRISLAFVLFTAATIAATAASEDGTLGGRPFTPPSDVVPMPEEWRKAPIKHKTEKPVALAVALDQQLYPALLPFIQDFAKARGVEIGVQNGTCGISGGVLAEKTADIGGFCCPPDFTDRLPGLRFHTVGVGSLALIVHPDNPVDSVTLQEAQTLFGGNAMTWTELPVSGIKTGPNQPVRAVARLHCKQRPGHWRLILDNENLFGRDIQEVSAITDMILQVGRTPGAIGYETLWHIDRHAEQQRVKPLLVEGIDPRDTEAMTKGRYPLYRVFNITTWADEPAANPLADELVDYILANAPKIDPYYGIIPAQELRRAGWRFHGNEVTGRPE